MSSLLPLEAPCKQGYSEKPQRRPLCGWKYLAKLPRLSLGGQREQSSKDRDSLASFKEVCKGRKLGSWNSPGSWGGRGGRGAAALQKSPGELCGDFDTRYRCVLIGNNMPRCLGVVGCGGT